MEDIDREIRDILGDQLYEELYEVSDYDNEEWYDAEEFHCDYKLIVGKDIWFEPETIIFDQECSIVSLIKTAFDKDNRSQIPVYLSIITHENTLHVGILDLTWSKNVYLKINCTLNLKSNQQIGVNIHLVGDKGDSSQLIIPYYDNPVVKYPGEMFFHDNKLVVAGTDSYYCVPLEEKHYQDATLKITQDGEEPFYDNGFWYLKNNKLIKITLCDTVYSQPSFTLGVTNNDGRFITAYDISPSPHLRCQFTDIYHRLLESEQLTGTIVYYLANKKNTISVAVRVIKTLEALLAVVQNGSLVIKIRGGLTPWYSDSSWFKVKHNNIELSISEINKIGNVVSITCNIDGVLSEVTIEDLSGCRDTISVDTI
jgi:hypothetical protein